MNRIKVLPMKHVAISKDGYEPFDGPLKTSSSETTLHEIGLHPIPKKGEQ